MLRMASLLRHSRRARKLPNGAAISNVCILPGPARPRFRKTLAFSWEFRFCGDWGLAVVAPEAFNAARMGSLRGRSLLFFFEDFALDGQRRELRRGADLVGIEPKVFDLLAYVIRNRDRVVSKDDL